ncbi:hypothetical protein CCO03_10085 [Comamonas serinivorans]|uniref:Beta-ketoacyl synthase-like N-terminal domain-containing protein n=1 Tax=Comamonas serinivorans TaxID=1082851 RepID=A0A1Y0EMV0_9BURK|nr:beta-ketoacyl synthase chain length factor [Comamonas serinivorans]ARU04985.1 hypothetical protein CCO03_10085 [Comamonas serinivorans]
MSVHALQAEVLGAGVLGPGLADWRQWQAVVAAPQTWTAAPTVLPAPSLLPPAERRRASRVVKAALEAGTQAVAQAGLVASELPVVFASSGGDGHNCHALCELLAGDDKQISPTRFHNSVHNAASGYWSIAAQAMAPAQVVAAFDGSFAMGLLEALSQVQYAGVPVLLIACDSEYPEPLHSTRPIADVSALALVLGPVGDARATAAGAPATLGRLHLDASAAWGSTPATALPGAWPAGLCALPAQLPPWRGLSLLAALAGAAVGDPTGAEPAARTLHLHVDDGRSLAVRLRVGRPGDEAPGSP